MLGRLFKQNNGNQAFNGPQCPSSGASITNNPPISPSSVNVSNFNSYEDPYTREILYGTHNSNQLKPFHFNNQLFRIVISQDGGNLRSKQVLYDSANDSDTPHAKSSPNSNNLYKSPPPKQSFKRNIMSSKVHHPSSELNDYMFGCGLPTTQTQSSVKIHILPSINSSVYGSSQSVLITRLFSITDVETTESSMDLSTSTYTPTWNPTPTLYINESSLQNFPFTKNSLSCQSSTPSTSSKSTASSINSRFAAGIIIPLESLHDLNDIVFNNWDEISHYLILLQKFTIKKLVHELNVAIANNVNSPDFSGCPCPYIINKRIQFPSYLLQNDQELHNQLLRLIKLVHYNANTPRLICSNSLIKHSILNHNSSYNCMLLDWVLEVLNWLEYKDGKVQNYSFSNAYPGESNSLSTHTFLASLLALIIPLRHQLSIKPFCNVTGTKSREITRVVIMTGNPVVAKKLIFIINAIIPSDMFSFDVKSENEYETKHDDHEANVYEAATVPTPTSRSLSNSPTAESPRSSVNTSSTKPIAIQSTKYSYPSSSTSSADNSVRSHSSVKGWEIPKKSGASVPSHTPSSSRVESNTQVIPISVTSNSSRERQSAQSGSLSKSTSLSQLSSSLNSSLSLSSSNYSLSKFGVSFMEKWKNSFGSYNSNNSSTSNTFTNQSQNFGSSYTYSSLDDYVQPPLFGGVGGGSGSLTKRNSIQSLRTPSPAIEHDDFTWQSNPMHSNGYSNGYSNGHSNGHSGSININNNSFNGHHSYASNMSMTPTKLSRTQSMFDLYNMNNSQQNSVSEETGEPRIIDKIRKSMEIKRTKTSTYIPIIKDNMVKNISEHNREVIKKKCANIMKTEVSLVRDPDSNILEVIPLNLKDHDVEKETRDVDGFEDMEEVDSFLADQCTITSNHPKKNKWSESEEKEKRANFRQNSILKSKPLLPRIAISDEFRPEFNVQSCPINPKLESQVIATMKNDLLFYQGNSNYDQITSTTIFISLRAREIKLIEMSLNEHMQEKCASNSAQNLPMSPPSDCARHRNDSVPNGHPSGKNTYKTKIKKVYTPAKNSGNPDNISKVENVLDEMNKLFIEQQANYNTFDRNGHKTSDVRKKESGKIAPDEMQRLAGLESFTNKLSNLVLNLVDRNFLD